MIREGGCHCGNHLRLTQRLSRLPWEIQASACGHSFCHATPISGDPIGVARWAQDCDLAEPYRFGSRSADFPVGQQYGIYIGAVCRSFLKKETISARRRLVRGSAPADVVDAGQHEEGLGRVDANGG